MSSTGGTYISDFELVEIEKAVIRANNRIEELDPNSPADADELERLLDWLERTVARLDAEPTFRPLKVVS